MKTKYQKSLETLEIPQNEEISENRELRNMIKTRKMDSMKLAIAYEHYRFVTPENIRHFRNKLEKESMLRIGPDVESYKRLVFEDVREYSDSIPTDILNDLEKAIDLNCFMYFEVASVKQERRNFPDPLLFGKVKGCPNYFFIGQWGDDIDIKDLINEREG